MGDTATRLVVLLAALALASAAKGGLEAQPAVGVTPVRLIERLRDDDRDARAERLELDVFVPVDSAGEWQVRVAGLWKDAKSSEPTLIAWARHPREGRGRLASDSLPRFEADSTRVGQVRLSFDGEQLRRAGEPGPWRLELKVAPASGGPDSPRRYQGVTSPHALRRFGWYAVRLGTPTWKPRAEGLDVHVPFEVARACSARIRVGARWRAFTADTLLALALASGTPRASLRLTLRDALGRKPRGMRPAEVELAARLLPAAAYGEQTWRHAAPRR